VSLPEIFGALQGQWTPWAKHQSTNAYPPLQVLSRPWQQCTGVYSGAINAKRDSQSVADPGILGGQCWRRFLLVSSIGLVRHKSTTKLCLGSPILAQANRHICVFHQFQWAIGKSTTAQIRSRRVAPRPAAAVFLLLSRWVLPKNDIAGAWNSWQIGGVGRRHKIDRHTAFVLPFLIVAFYWVSFCARKLTVAHGRRHCPADKGKTSLG